MSYIACKNLPLSSNLNCIPTSYVTVYCINYIEFLKDPCQEDNVLPKTATKAVASAVVSTEPAQTPTVMGEEVNCMFTPESETRSLML